MSTFRLITASLITFTTLAAAQAQQAAPAREQSSRPVGPTQQVNNVAPIPATPAAIREVVLVQPFTLTTPYTHEWRKERPSIDAGVIVVFRAESELVRPRQVAQPVLLVGSQTAEPVNIGYASGTIVAIVPATRNADGTVAFDLSVAPVWYGQPELPETVDAAWIDAQRQVAEGAGIKAVSAQARDAAVARGGAALALADRDALDKVLGGLVRTYAADETEKADQLEGKASEATPTTVAPK